MCNFILMLEVDNVVQLLNDFKAAHKGVELFIPSPHPVHDVFPSNYLRAHH
jgi:hypothetical protein